MFYQDESEKCPFTEHPRVGGQHQVGCQRLESLTPHLGRQQLNTQDKDTKINPLSLTHTKIPYFHATPWVLRAQKCT